MWISARAFVAAIFVLLGLSFVVTTGALYYEFGHQNPDGEWFSLMAFYSHLFIFFPTLGIVALVAFYWPAVAFTDMYWRHIPLGGLRFALGFVVLLLCSLYFADQLGKGDLRSIWEVKPDVLLADQGGVVPDCEGDAQSCARAPIMTALAAVRRESQQRVGMRPFVRECKPDPLIELPAERAARRYCFATGTLVNAEDCCRAQEAFGRAVGAMHVKPENRSLTEKVHIAMLPLKIFFLLVVLVIAILLIIWRRSLPHFYPHYIRKIQRGILIGAFSMLLLPLMNLAFLQSSGLLYGNAIDSVYRSAAPGGLVVVGVWALMLLFFFFQEASENKDLETFARVAGLVGSGVFALNYQVVIDYFTLYLGSGATQFTIGALIAGCLGLHMAILLQPKLIMPVLGKGGLTAKEGSPER